MKNPSYNALFNAVRSKPNKSYIRALHASPGSPAVDIYVNDNVIYKNLNYKEFTDYINVSSGFYNIKIYPAGQKRNPIINTNIAIPSENTFTVAAIGELADISLLAIPEAYMQQINNQDAFVGFIHLSPNAPAVDITLPDNTKLFEDVDYKEYTGYIKVIPGDYTLQVKPAGSDQIVLSVPNVKFNPGEIYSVYAVGLVGEEPQLEVLLVNDNKN